MMRRRNFLETLAVGSSLFAVAPLSSLSAQAAVKQIKKSDGTEQLEADVVIAGGGLGGFAAAMAALRNGQSVIMTEETDWIGGQLTQQGVPPDEHAWIETTGATQLYRDFRNGVRDYYRKNYPLTEAAKDNPLLNPGNGVVSQLCHEPRVALAVLTDMLNPYLSTGQLILLLEHKVTAADTDGDRVNAIHVKESRTGAMKKLAAPFFVDATELGDLLPLTGTEFVTGTESKTDTDELHAPEKADPSNNQAFTMCFAMDYIPGEDHTIKKPDNYTFWRNHVPDLTPPWPGKLLELHYSNPKTLQPKKLGFDPRGGETGDALNLWNYRKIISKANFVPGTYPGEITLVNWPQNDYMLGNIVGVSEEEFNKHVAAAKVLSLSLLYWLQTEAPRPDGGKGWPGLRLRKDIMGTSDGLAKYPYVRESRRIKALFTIREEHVGKANRERVAQTNKDKAAEFYDSVGIGYYHIDLHPSSNRVNYVDFDSLRFQIPLGALLPIRMKNLLPANKNIGTTHITNGCYRLHPVEWSIGEAVGLLISYAHKKALTPAEVRKDGKILADFQSFIRSQGIETAWPEQQ
ncbi:FAD-dependent oxidoreductase [Parapedobacter soli]|uniref:FAD-dependent oxidoreductase n=1 Tax=Parapedobacter soli TaxID=416955 RepID=UPI0021C6FB48|nr:FAD-dependent oxidoreductase [Parapedobacter soli]